MKIKETRLSNKKILPLKNKYNSRIKLQANNHKNNS